MTWNHRVFKEKTDNLLESELYTIREVYYDKDGNIDGYTDPISVASYSIEGLQVMLQWMLDALDKPILSEDELNDDKTEQRDYEDNKRPPPSLQ